MEEVAQHNFLYSLPNSVTFVEVLPKEKKQKEEKTYLLGQCTIDLLPLVKGETRYKSTLQIHPLQGSPLESLGADAQRVSHPFSEPFHALGAKSLSKNIIKSIL